MAEWKAKTLKEVKTSDGVVWRAQITVAPDGRKFVGVRKFAVKKDKTEVVTKDGLSLIVQDGKVPVETIQAITNLLSVFSKSKATETATQFVLRNRTTGKFEHKGKHEVLTFRSAAAARSYRDKHCEEPGVWLVKRQENT